ncbi:DMT family transporter [Celerinatantimonas sp. YJH-8]|uniref:DMT family transporter n=1 Tax=Celerinatantimonas sp. YJH-8 TaxID=3228714 RepID=UPI0038C89F38
MYIGWIFVFFWASGYIASAIGLQYTNPLTFITIRIVIAFLLFYLTHFIKNKGRFTLSKRDIIACVIVGAFIQFIYPVTFAYSLALNISPAMLTIILGLQPVITLFISRDISYKIQIVGIVGCLLGTILFSIEDFSLGTSNIENIGYAVISLLAITLGSIMQKKYCSHINIIENMSIQCFAALFLLIPSVSILGPFSFEVNAASIISVLWQGVLISFVSSVLLIRALRLGAVTHVSIYFSCVPVFTAVMAYIVLGSALTMTMLGGMFFIIACTFLVQNPGYFEAVREKLLKKI